MHQSISNATVMISVTLLLGACTTGGGGIQSASGMYSGTNISPIRPIKLGEVYRSSAPLSKAALPEVSELCPGDYVKTRALAAIRSKYSNSAPYEKADENLTLTNAKGIGVTGVQLKWLTVAGSYKPTTTTTADFKGVTYYAMTPGDVDTVLKKLGTGCRSDIKKWKADGYGVYIPQGAYKADTINITTKTDRNAGADVKLQVGKIKPGFTLSDNDSATVTVSGKNFYYKLVPAGQ